MFRPRQARQRPAGGDLSGWTYAVPGVVSWFVMLASLVGVFFFPDAWTWVATIFVGYLLCYSSTYFIFALVGEYKRRRADKVDWTADEDVVGPFGFAPSDLRHAVIVPNYKEPDAVLERTVAAIAAQHRASERVVLVLGMEEREQGARDKAEAIAERYRDAFLRVVVSIHPANIPGELACKASNQTYASIEARRLMVDELGIPLEHITVSTCDADSVFHPRYFAALSRMYATDARRHSRIWQAPLFYYNNIWTVPAPIRYTAWFIHAGQMAELAMPFYDGLPISTYTLSMRLAEETQYWDPAVISEDWHVYLGVMFARDGDVSVQPIFLPTYSDATDGPTPWQALVNRYLQVLRHSWGAEDVGFLLETMIGEKRWPRAITAFRSMQVLHDHVMRVAAWFIVMSGYLLDVGMVRTAMARTIYEAVTTTTEPLHIVLRWFLIAGITVITTSVLIEIVRNPAPKSWPIGRLALEVILMWLSMPFIGFFLGVAPAVHAQTKLMFRLPLAWRVTPKHLAERLGDAA
ncbi:MAG: glycosyltransferase [Coriobacteriia bacterium]|nr:glycosyltransferase [Coriobacteriia bacterium]